MQLTLAVQRVLGIQMTQALVLPEKCSVLNETDEAKFLLDKDFFSSIIPHMDI